VVSYMTYDLLEIIIQGCSKTYNIGILKDL